MCDCHVWKHYILYTKSLLDKIFVHIFHDKKNNIYVSALYKSNITKIIYYCWPSISIFLLEKKKHHFGSPQNINACVTCCHARQIYSFPCKGQINKSENIRMSQGKFNSFKEVRGRSHIHRSQKCSIGRILFQDQSILHFTSRRNLCNK